MAAGNKIYGTAATSYLNFVITNKVVLIPKCYVEDDPLFGTDEIKHSDETFKNLVGECFSPDRAVVAINPLAVNFGVVVACIVSLLTGKPRKFYHTKVKSVPLLNIITRAIRTRSVRVIVMQSPLSWISRGLFCKVRRNVVTIF